MRTLKAIKPHKYGTRHLIAGEEYEAPDKQALVLVAARKARFADKPLRVAPATPPAAAPETERAAEPVPAAQSLDDLRLQATQLGINVDGRWGVARLQHEIEQAKR